MRRLGGYRWALLGTIVFSAVAARWMRDLWGGYETTLWMANAVSIVGPLLGGAMCLHRAEREAAGAATGWRLLGYSALAWGGGQFLWSYQELWVLRDVPPAEREAPFPYWSDLGYLATLPLAAAALLRLPQGAFKAQDRARLIADGAVVATSLLLAAWLWLLRPYVGYEAPASHVFVALLYPLGDLLLATIGLWSIAYTPASQRPALGLVWLGVLLFIVGDLMFAVFALGGGGGIPVFNILWPAAFLLFGCAALRPVLPTDQVVGHVERLRWLPAAVFLSTLVLAFLYGQWGPMSAALLILACGTAFVRIELLRRDGAFQAPTRPAA